MLIGNLSTGIEHASWNVNHGLAISNYSLSITINMGNTENLHSIEAVNKIKELIEKANICLFTTKLTSVPLSSRPMSTLRVDENGIIWFFSKVDSDKNMHLKQDDRVQLFY